MKTKTVEDTASKTDREEHVGKSAVIRPVHRSRISEEILIRLVGLIVDGVYPPGSKLPPERKLSEQFGVNRASLREALRQLESMGVVFVRQGGGIFIQDFASHAGLEFVSFLIRKGIHLDKKMILDIAEMRIQFGKMMISMAIDRLTDDSRAGLEKSVRAVKEARLEDRQSGELDFAFYYELAKATDNRIVVFVLNTIRDVMTRVIGIYFQVEDNPKSSLKLYSGLLNAIVRKDKSKALKVFEQQARKDDALLATMLEGLE